MAGHSLEEIATYLDQSILPQYAKQAETQLKTIESQPGFSINLLHVVSSTNLSPATRLAGALFFKNLVKRKWVNEDGEYLLPVDDINAIKRDILDIMIKLPNQLQIQIGESISLIAESDFPHNWTNLIDELVGKLSLTDFVLNKGILLVAHSIFKKWRPLFRSDELFLEIKMVLDKFSQPFLALLVKVDELIIGALNSQDKASLGIYFENLLLLIQIYYDLNSQDIPEFFEDNLSTGFDILYKYLELDTKLISDPESDDEIDNLIKVKTAVIELLLLYISRYAEEFKPLTDKFINAVWQLINSFVTKQKKYDLLVVKSLSFLTSVTKMADYQHYFNNESSLKEIIEKIILPNIYFREIDEEMFEDEPINYVRSDLEGSDFDTRRKSATDFLRELKEVNSELLTNTVMTYVDQFLSHSDWRNKDIAIYLFSSLAAKGNVTNVGVTSTNVLVDVVKFFTGYIANDLVSQDSHPILKTDAIKYIFTFRNQLTKEQLITTIPLLLNHFQNPNPVVYTYSAITIEKLLSMTDFSDASHSPVFNKTDIQPYTSDLLTNLFRLILLHNESPEKLAENEFLIKGVVKVLNTAEDLIDSSFKITLIEQLLLILKNISKNPSNPKFTHYVFESLGLLIKYGGNTSERISQYTTIILPTLLEILGDDVQEFVPYIFQILAFLLEEYPSSAPLPQEYQNLIKPLLSPVVWEFRGNIPGITRLLVAILQQDPAIFGNSEASLTPLLGVFQKLISSKVNDVYGFDLLESILLNIPANVLEKFLGQIAVLLLTRLKNSRTEKYIRKFTVLVTSLSCVPLNELLSRKTSGHINANFVIQFIDSVQPGVFQQIYNSFILPTAGNLANLQDRKLATLGLSQFINSDAFTKGAYTSLVIPTIEQLTKTLSNFGGLLKSASAVGNTISGTHSTAVAVNELDLESSAFGSQFSKLVSIQIAPFDPLPTVKSSDQSAIRYGTLSNIKKLESLGVLSQVSSESQQVLASI